MMLLLGIMLMSIMVVMDYYEAKDEKERLERIIERQ